MSKILVEQRILFLLENGLVTLSVHGEFEVKLGITSDSSLSPWHIYKTELFVRDSEEPGRSRLLLSIDRSSVLHIFALIFCTWTNTIVVFYSRLVSRTGSYSSIASKSFVRMSMNSSLTDV
jgi:hypothetical protein